MHKGDVIIAEHPESKSNRLIRSYGVVQKVTDKTIVTIKMADGSVIKRHINSVAVYIQPPDNWDTLYQQQVAFCHPRQRNVFRNSHSEKKKR